MGLLSKLGTLFNYDEYDEYDDYDDFFDEDDDYIDDVEKPKKSFFKRSFKKDVDDVEVPERKIFSSKSKITEFDARPKAVDVCVLTPKTYNECTDISDALLNKKAVVLNLEGLPVEVAQRIVDFTTGACVIIDGSFKSVSGSVFVITPRSIDIAGGIDDLLLNNFGIEK